MHKDFNPEFLPRLGKGEFLRPIRPWTRLSGLLLTGTVGVLATFACTVPYPVTIRAVATVRPAGELKLVQSAAAGTVKAIRVSENQKVTQGEIIAEIEDTRQGTQKSQLLGNIQQAQLELGQIQAQLSALDGQVAAERSATQQAVAEAEAYLQSNQRDHQDRQVAASTEVREAEAEVEKAKSSREKAREEWLAQEASLLSTAANLKSAEASLNSARSKQSRYQSLAESGSVSQQQLEEAKLAADQQEQALEAQKATLEAQKRAVEAKKRTFEAEKQAVEVASAQLERAKAALNPSAAPVAIARERIAQEQSRGEATLATLIKEREALIQRQIEIKSQLSSHQKQLQQVDSELSQSVIRAPVSGAILKLELRNPGQVVAAGAPIAQIAPNEADLLVKARVAAQDISQVKPCTAQNVAECQGGQGKVILKFSAYPYPDYGTLKGAVRQISADAIVPPDGGEAYYEVTVQLEKPYLVRGDRQYPLKAGMEARSDIIARDETVLTFLLRKGRLIADL